MEFVAGSFPPWPLWRVVLTCQTAAQIRIEVEQPYDPPESPFLVVTEGNTDANGRTSQCPRVAAAIQCQ